MFLSYQDPLQRLIETRNGLAGTHLEENDGNQLSFHFFIPLQYLSTHIFTIFINHNKNIKINNDNNGDDDDDNNNDDEDNNNKNK